MGQGMIRVSGGLQNANGCPQRVMTKGMQLMHGHWVSRHHSDDNHAPWLGCLEVESIAWLILWRLMVMRWCDALIMEVDGLLLRRRPMLFQAFR